MIENSVEKDMGRSWTTGPAPIAVILISLNEAHNLEDVFENLSGWARQVFLVDSYSRDNTVDIALSYGVHVVQREFRGFGDQWNFAIDNLPITTPFTMKIDPDERLSDELKKSILAVVSESEWAGFSFQRRLWFMNHPLPTKQWVTRIWKTGSCHFSDVIVNEHPIIQGSIKNIPGIMEHHDSPDLDHWVEKQNRYSTSEAIARYNNFRLADNPNLFGTGLQRRMWIKKNFHKLPLRYFLLFLYHWVWQGAWTAGWPGFVWARLRSDTMRLKEYKWREMNITGRITRSKIYGAGAPDARVDQYK